MGSYPVQVPLVILGNLAYPLLRWLMKPYPNNELTTVSEKACNYRQSRALMVIDNTIGKLKGQWRCLLKQLDFHIDNVPNVVASCITFHNFCEKVGGYCHPEWIALDEEEPGPTPVATTTTASQCICDAIKESLH